MTAPGRSLAIDAGSRYVRLARVGPGGTPEPVELEGAVPGEGLPVPGAAAGDRGAALRAAYDAYLRHHDAPHRLLVVVPQHDRAAHACRAADALAAPPGAGPAPDVRTLATPHAVLALLRHTGGVAPGRYAVCDLGAAAAEVSVCTVTPGAVAVAPTSRHAPDDGYGTGFDTALLTRAGLPPDEDHRRALAAVRAEPGAARRLGLVLDRAARDPGRFEATAVHHVAGRPVTAGAVRSALPLLTDGLDRALAEALGPGRDTPLALVGGVARLGPLRPHLDAAGRPLTALPEGTDPAHAAVLGAALVAAGRVDPADRYPYEVRVGAHRTEAGHPADSELLVSAAGTLEPGGPVVFAEADGRRIGVRTRADHPVRVRVGAPGSGAGTPVRTLTLPGGDATDRFHVGVRIAVDGTAALVLHPLGAGTPGAFPLGILPADIGTDSKEVGP
ncbi:hypothetical protein ACIOEZ_22710 [Streptomyces sp. NPDC087866]|uniref:hypothetical protein n=1 Tax=unclassified Streptomyces TaxID=2593676 RepID=UPI0033B87A5C